MKQKIVILGGGESGIGSAMLAAKKGYAVYLSDAGMISPANTAILHEYLIEFEEGGHTWSNISDAALVIKSPGIDPKSEIVKQCLAQGLKIIDEIEFAYSFATTSKIIAVTGSNGKSTTVSLLYHILKTAHCKVALVGNIGNSFAKQVALDPQEYYVIEMSSFQLDGCRDFHPHVSILLNITEDHLNRYDGQMDQYIASKFQISRHLNASDYFIYCMDDERIEKYLSHLSLHTNLYPFSMKRKPNRGAFLLDDTMFFSVINERMDMNVQDLVIKGKHNVYNSMAATIGALSLGIKNNTIREALQSFTGLEHRLEFVASIKGVEYYNDSKATNINSTWYALEAVSKPIVLILGGIDKGNDYSLIADLVKQKVKAIVCMGLDNSKIINAFKDFGIPLIDAHSLDEATNQCYRLASHGDLVLLSPACASFDLFKNYEDRGKQFKQKIFNL